MSTTFTALSTAFAKAVECGSAADAVKDEERRQQKAQKARAYLAILVGPSLGTAKAKVLFAVDGLEVTVWGERVDGVAEEAVGEDDEGVESQEEDKGEESEEEDAESEGEEEEEESEEEQVEEANAEEGGAGEIYDEATPPPSSPSPSPSPPPPLLSSPLPVRQPKSSLTHAQQQQILFGAERLLSRTLADADAHGYGLNSDMGELILPFSFPLSRLYVSCPAPTQTHLLIRAPRRFSHPAWVPRQNVTTMMESALEEFLEESGLRGGKGRKTGKGNKKRVEGVWIVCRDAGRFEEDEPVNEEDDEMIWWSWEGKLIGFSDW